MPTLNIVIIHKGENRIRNFSSFKEGVSPYTKNPHCVAVVLLHRKSDTVDFIAAHTAAVSFHSSISHG